MKRIKFVFLLLLSLPLLGNDFFFTPPKEWKPLNSVEIQKKYHHVKLGYTGKSKKGLPPSLNLAIEKIGTLSLVEYLNAVKQIHESDAHNLEWKNLGSFSTQAGKATLTQVERRTEWGKVLLLQLIFIANQNAYVLTASALKEEFVLFYKEFETAFRSFKLGEPTSP